MDLFSCGNAQDFDFDKMMDNILKNDDSEESKEIEEMRRKAKEEINKNHDLEIEDLENDDDLVNGGMNLKYELLEKENEEEEEEKEKQKEKEKRTEEQKEEEEEEDIDIDAMIKEVEESMKNEPKKTKVEEMEDDRFFDQFVEDILGKDKESQGKEKKKEEEEEKSMGNTASIRLGRRRRNRGSEETLESKEVNEFLDEIAKMDKRDDEEETEKEKGEEGKDGDQEGQKRDIYIQQKDQYFVDDEEVYLNELETDHCNWDNIKSLFKVITEEQQQFTKEEDSSRETVLDYFHDICSGLLNSRSEDFLGFVYSSPDVMDSLIHHAGFDGVYKTLDKVLNLYESINNLNSFRFLKHRFGLYRKILRTIFSSEDKQQISQLIRVFIKLVKEKNNIIDANYFIDKILLENDNHVRILDKIVKEENVLLAELASLMIKRVVPEEERGFLEENSVREINKNFGRISKRINL